jgi:hypothetical protein
VTASSVLLPAQHNATTAYGPPGPTAFSPAPPPPEKKRCPMMAMLLVVGLLKQLSGDTSNSPSVWNTETSPLASTELEGVPYGPPRSLENLQRQAAEGSKEKLQGNLPSIYQKQLNAPPKQVEPRGLCRMLLPDALPGRLFQP